MNHKALVVIDIQNDITKHYRDIIDRLNAAIEWAAESGMEIVYIQHNNLSAGTRTFKPGTKGAELVPELKIVSDHIFVKTKANALTSEAFSEFIRSKDIREFYITGADATGCVKSTCFNMAKAGYAVHVISDCVTSYDLKKLPEMLAYYRDKGCEVKNLSSYTGHEISIREIGQDKYYEQAVTCVKDTVLPAQIKLYKSCGGDFDKIYGEAMNGNGYFGKVIKSGHVYELGYEKCTCPKVQSGQVTDPDQCNCSRQSILYILSCLEPASKFEVEILETIMRGAEHCRFQITKY